MVFHWRLSDSKSPQDSRTLLSILAVFNNAVVWMVSTRPPTSKSSRPFYNHLVTVPKAPIKIGIIVTFMFHSFFNSLTRSRYLSLLLLLLFTPLEFSHQCWLMVFHWSLGDSNSPPVSRIRLRILAVLSNAVVWIVSTRPPTSKSSRPFNKPLVIVPNAPITIGTIVPLMFHSFFNSLARSWYLSFFSLSFRFIRWSAGTAKSTILQILFFPFLIIIRSGLLARIRRSVCMLKSHKSLCESFSRTGAGLCIYHLFVWSN